MSEENLNNQENQVNRPKAKKRRKKTVSDIELQIKELQKKKEEMILKSKSEIADYVLSILANEGITIEDVEENKDLFFDELKTLLENNLQNFSEAIKD